MSPPSADATTTPLPVDNFPTTITELSLPERGGGREGGKGVSTMGMNIWCYGNNSTFCKWLHYGRELSDVCLGWRRVFLFIYRGHVLIGCVDRMCCVVPHAAA